MSFLPALNLTVNGIPVIAYIEGNHLRGLASNEKLAFEFLTNTITTIWYAGYSVFDELRLKPDFAQAIVWSKGRGDINVDLWLRSKLDSYGPSGPQSDVMFFRDDQLVAPDDWGVSSGDVHILLGLEELHRRKVMKNGGTLESYITGPRPELPKELTEPFPGTGL